MINIEGEPIEYSTPMDEKLLRCYKKSVQKKERTKNFKPKKNHMKESKVPKLLSQHITKILYDKYLLHLHQKQPINPNNHIN